MQRARKSAVVFVTLLIAGWGFFADVGCAWPVRNSTTYYLEKHLG